MANTRNRNVQGFNITNPAYLAGWNAAVNHFGIQGHGTPVMPSTSGATGMASTVTPRRSSSKRSRTTRNRSAQTTTTGLNR